MKEGTEIETRNNAAIGAPVFEEDHTVGQFCFCRMSSAQTIKRMDAYLPM